MALRSIFTVTLLVLGLSALPLALGRTTDVAMSKGNLEHSFKDYAWVHYNISYESSGNLVIKNSIIKKGKWCYNGDPNQESKSPDETRIDKTLPAQVYACGSLSDSDPKTVGGFGIWEDKIDGKQACGIHFHNYWREKAYNFFDVVSVGKDYICSPSGGSESGPIGDVSVRIDLRPLLSVI